MIQVTVKLFTVLRENFGKEILELELPDGTTCADVIAQLESESEKIRPILERSFLAINGTYAAGYTRLAAGDELSLLPPVSSEVS